MSATLTHHDADHKLDSDRDDRTPVVAYLRQSKAHDDETDDTSASIETQRRWCGQEADRHGYRIVAEYVDRVPAGAISRRQEWARLLRDVKARSDVRGLLAYNAKRIARDADYESMVYAKLHGRGLTFVNAGGTEYPTDGTADPQKQLMRRIMGAISEHDNLERAAAIRGAMDLMRENALPSPGGVRQFGYTVGHEAIIEEEAAAIRDAVERVLIGESMTGIARSWNAAGIQTTLGNKWTRQSFTRLMRSPTIAALRQQHDGTYKLGAWPAIITREKWNQLATAMADRSRMRTRSDTGRRTRRLLTGVMFCGKCGAKMRGGRTRDLLQYQCAQSAGTAACGGTAINGDPTDAYVVGTVLNRFASNADAIGRYVKRIRDADQRVRAVQDELAELAERRALVMRLAARTGDEQAAMSALDEIEQAETQARAQLRAASAPLEVLTDARVDPAEWWANASFERRRALLGVLIEAVTIGPAPGGRKWLASRVTITWRV